MCFIVLAYEQHPRYRLVLATNRDEFYARPTAAAAFWNEAPALLAGCDLKGGGTWLGVTRTGRVAALTNVRDMPAHKPDAPTRGALVADYLKGTASPRAYLEALRPEADRYNGFNLLVGDTESLCYFSNYGPHPLELGPGLYGLSNALLDTPWPKVERGKKQLQDLLQARDLDPEALLDFLVDVEQAPDEELPETGIGLEWERVLSSIFIESPEYGTRASTVVLIDYEGRVTFIERRHGPDMEGPERTRRFSFLIEPAPVG